MYYVYLALSVAVVALGALSVTKATLGVALIAAGIWFAILARLAQASNQHNEILGAVRRAAQDAADTREKTTDMVK
jgi:hypothetical protein